MWMTVLDCYTQLGPYLMLFGKVHRLTKENLSPI